MGFMLKMFSVLSTSLTLLLMPMVFTPTTYARSLFSRPLPSFTVAQAAPTMMLMNHDEKDSSSQNATENNAPATENAQQDQQKRTLPPLDYPNVNQYIIEHHLPHSKIVKDPRMNTLPHLNYKYGTYIGVVIHEVGEDNRTLQQWVDRMYATYERAFVHAFVDNQEIHLTAPSEYYVWGAGKQANPYFYQIEVVRMYTFDDFARSVNNQAWLAAYMLKQNHLTPTLADDQEGVGSVISHNAVRKYWGGTTHVDPIAYYARWGYDMHQFFDLVKYHYNHM